MNERTSKVEIHEFTKSVGSHYYTRITETESKKERISNESEGLRKLNSFLGDYQAHIINVISDGFKTRYFIAIH